MVYVPGDGSVDEDASSVYNGPQNDFLATGPQTDLLGQIGSLNETPRFEVPEAEPSPNFGGNKLNNDALIKE